MQKAGKYDLNTRSWLETPAATREAGFAMLGDRVGAVVNVHEYDADYSRPNRGWRASLRV